MTQPPRQIFRQQALDSQEKRPTASANFTGGKRSLWGRLSSLVSRRQRVPVVLQMTNAECGLACLTMVLGFFGRKTAISECRRLYAPGRDGITAAAILKMARAFGLQARGLSVDLDALPTLALPAIAHWNFDHFVVVESVHAGGVTIVDPGWGRRELSVDEFALGFTGVALVFSPESSFQKKQSQGTSSWRYLFDLARASRAKLGQIFAASLLLQLFGLALPALTKIVVDNVPWFGAANTLLFVGSAIALWVTAFAVVTFVRTTLLIYLQSRLDQHMMSGFFEHLLSLPYQFFQQRATGDLLSRLRSSGDIREALTSQTISILIDGSLALVYFGVLLSQEPRFALLTFAVAAVQTLLLLATARSLEGLSQRELAAQAESQSFLVEALKGIVTIKVTGTEGQAFAYWSRMFNVGLQVSIQRNRLAGRVDSVLAALRLLAPLVVLCVGAQRVLSGAMTEGTMLALSALSAMVLVPLTSLATDVQKLHIVSAHLDRLADVLDAKSEQDARVLGPTPRLTGHIEMRNVSFRYGADGPFVLRNINLIIRPGQKVAFIGRTGSGKTTLALLLLGFYEPTEGEILFDGIPSRDINYKELRRQFGVVLQDPVLFSTSIHDNIALGDQHCATEDVKQAARLAAIHDDIMHMPMGYHTRISEGGSGLSGGQRARIAIARALVHKPSLLIFDEATSNLDVVTEKQVDANLSALACTRLVVAHRLSTVRNADHIVMLDGGLVVEQGTHESLLALAGRYADLLRS